MHTVKTKRTVRVDQELLQAAKRYASRQGITLSSLIEEYLRTPAIQQDEAYARTPVLQRLTGILPEDATLLEYHRYVEE
jgi:hypothetical protein